MQWHDSITRHFCMGDSSRTIVCPYTYFRFQFLPVFTRTSSGPASFHADHGFLDSFSPISKLNFIIKIQLTVSHARHSTNADDVYSSNTTALIICNCSRLRFGHIYLFIYLWTEVLWFIYLAHWTLACNKFVYYYYLILLSHISSTDNHSNILQHTIFRSMVWTCSKYKTIPKITRFTTEWFFNLSNVLKHST